MCGIAGIFLDPKIADPRQFASITAMTATLYHRGPDGGGTWIDAESGVSLGHRRLSIVDLSDAGQQPMLSHDKSLVMTFNGEVYNFSELRLKLEQIGHQFRGHSDSEVILAAFESFGFEASLPQFSGMFALGVWDRNRRVLHLARDRMGKKPLYIAVVRGGIAFASELKAILAYRGFEPRINHSAITTVLQYGFIPDHCCIWENVFKLPPGASLSISADALRSTIVSALRQEVRRWWRLDEIARDGQRLSAATDQENLENELDQLLRAAVQQRMKADVPFGVFLSGGIDSTMIAAMMQSQSEQPVRSFTIGFAESGYDEAHHASQIARHLGTEHTEFRVTPKEALAIIPEIAHAWDEPFADESQIPTLLLSRLARQHVTVALSGDGGDECFGGYSRHIMAARLAPLFRLPPKIRHLALSALRKLDSTSWERLFRNLPLSEGARTLLVADNLRKLEQVLSAANQGHIYQRLMTSGCGWQSTPAELIGDDNIPDLPDIAASLIYCDMASYLVADILVKLDRATMATGLEARSPFLDHNVVEFAWRLPTNLKVRRGQGKWLLRQVLRRYVPEYLFERPKQGFNVPIGGWLRGPLRDWAQGLLDMNRIRDDGLLDLRNVQASWQEHLTGRHDQSRYLWSVLMVQSWLDAHRSVGAAPPAPEPAQVKYHAEAAS